MRHSELVTRAPELTARIDIARHRLRQRFRAISDRGFLSVVDLESVRIAERNGPWSPVPRPECPTPMVINFVVTGVGPGSGGIRTLLRLVGALEAQGHTCRLYISILTRSPFTLDEQRGFLQREFPHIKADLLPDARLQASADACVATAWQTVYPVLAYGGNAARLYLVQDFEPAFYPAGSMAALAENTYRLNLLGLTIGHALATKLRDEFDMPCRGFDYPVDVNVYTRTNPGPRNGVVFYGRSATPRRGTELGLLAIAIFHDLSPDTPIHLVGEFGRLPPLGFPYTAHGNVSPSRLAELYNMCAAGLVLSFTNVSLAPYELLAAGCRPVVNDLRLVRDVLADAPVVYAPPSPLALAKALNGAVHDGPMTKETTGFPPTWDTAGKQFERLVVDAVRNGW